MKTHKPNYRAWLIDEADFPYQSSISEQIQFLTGYGILAPSQHNTQPWNIAVRANELHLTPDETKQLPVGDPHNFGLWLSLGCFVENIVQAAAVFGLHAGVSYQADKAVLTFDGNAVKPETTEVLNDITHRYSFKFPFDTTGIDDRATNAINTVLAATPDSVEAKLIILPEQLQEFKEIHMAAAAQVAGDPAFVRELVHWMRSNGTDAEDGMPGFVVGSSPLKSLIAPKLLAKKPAVFKKALGHERVIIASTPAFIVWLVTDRSPNVVMECGRHMQRTWLTAVHSGLVAQPVTATTAQSESIAKIQSLVGSTGQPVLVLRLGYGSDKGLRTPRSRRAV